MTAKSPAAGYSHNLDIYGAILHLCTRKRQLERLQEDMPGADPWRSDATGLTTSLVEIGPPNLHHVVIFVDTLSMGEDTAMMVNTIAHEAAHAAGFILNHVGAGATLSTTTDAAEHVAYLIGWIAEWVWHHLN